MRSINFFKSLQLKLLSKLFGIIGSICFLLSNYYAFNEFGNQVGLIVSTISGSALIILVVYMLKSKTWEKLSLKKTNTSKFNKGKTKLLKIGDEGITTLNPGI